MNSAFLPSCLTILVFASVCAVSDYLTHKIPNTLILCGLLCAAVSRLSPQIISSGTGMSHAALIPDMAAGFLIPWLLLGIFVFLKMLGGGDVKMLSVIGVQVGWRGCLTVIRYSFFAAAGISVLIILRRKNLYQRMEYLRMYVGRVLVTGKAVPYRDGGGDDSPQSGEFAFAVPVYLGLILYLAEFM